MNVVGGYGEILMILLITLNSLLFVVGLPFYDIFSKYEARSIQFFVAYDAYA